MIRRLEHDRLSADLAAVEELLASAPPGDVLGRMSLAERRDEVRAALAEVGTKDQQEGRTALFFGGAPVIGSRGIDADFAAEALGKYQDLVTKVWALKEHGPLAPSGPVPDRRLHADLARRPGNAVTARSPVRTSSRLTPRAGIASPRRRCRR